MSANGTSARSNAVFRSASVMRTVALAATMLLESRRSALQRQFQEVDAPFISMLGKSAGQGGLSDPPRIPQCELRQDLRDSRTVGSHQNLSARLEELADAVPRIGDEARSGPGRPSCRHTRRIPENSSERYPPNSRYSP